jgi:hypothetical protein
MVSIIIGILGIIGTGVVVPYLEKKIPNRPVQQYWFLGLAGLFPAWLTAFLGLLRPVSQGVVEAPLPPPALLSSGMGVLGIIAADYLLRRFQKRGQTLAPAAYWALGWVALLPAWIVAIIGQ